MEKEAIKTIKIDNGVCFSCGEEFEPTGPLMRTLHHCLPKLIDPKFNVIVPLHKVCHQELNSIYAHSKAKPPEAFGLSAFKRTQNSVQGLVGHSEAFSKKIQKVADAITKDIEKRESKDAKTKLP